jgi:hypothetical protein
LHLSAAGFGAAAVGTGSAAQAVFITGFLGSMGTSELVYRVITMLTRGQAERHCQGNAHNANGRGCENVFHKKTIKKGVKKLLPERGILSATCVYCSWIGVAISYP